MVDLGKVLQTGQGALGKKIDRLSDHVLTMTSHPPIFFDTQLCWGGSEAPDRRGQRDGGEAGQRATRAAVDTELSCYYPGSIVATVQTPCTNCSRGRP